MVSNNYSSKNSDFKLLKNVSRETQLKKYKRMYILSLLLSSRIPSVNSKNPNQTT